ncbi:20467_t:CDS:10 [Gigaspora margarita]|uniref:20467_t:CDS:1 n=1 Tax=Gigaspora margarita TaxID=4874 RepID=A0ABM8VY74_GIGMA|nr:20467_t:CDS:10 [Gigaspora margarita]
MAYVEVFCLLFFSIFIFHLIKRPRIGLNEPPLVPYRYPIIGHTYRLLYDAENFLKECKEKYGEPFSLYVFGSVRTFTGVDSTPEVLRNSDVFDFNTGVNKTFPFIDMFKQFTDFKPSYMARVVHEHVSGKISVYTSRMQKELVSEIEKFIGDCKEPKFVGNIQETLSRIIAKPVANVLLGEEGANFEDIIVSFTTAERALNKMRFAPEFLLYIHPSLYKFISMLPLKFGWNPITQHRDIFVQHCKPIIEERICQRKKLGEKYIQKEDLLDFFISESGKDIIDDNLLNHLFGVIYRLVFAGINYGGRPELWNELYEEQLKIHHESNGYLSTEDVNKKMVKLDCFLKESFRHSIDIAMLPHTVIDTAFNNKLFGETSNEFQPKRHITSFSNGKTVHSPATKVDRSFITFGGGKHACPGRFFAVNEIKICLHKLILKYNIRTESGKIVPPITMSSFKMLPRAGLTFENRN